MGTGLSALFRPNRALDEPIVQPASALLAALSQAVHSSRVQKRCAHAFSAWFRSVLIMSIANNEWDPQKHDNELEPTA